MSHEAQTLLEMIAELKALQRMSRPTQANNWTTRFFNARYYLDREIRESAARIIAGR